MRLKDGSEIEVDKCPRSTSLKETFTIRDAIRHLPKLEDGYEPVIKIISNFLNSFKCYEDLDHSLDTVTPKQLIKLRKFQQGNSMSAEDDEDEGYGKN